MSKSNFVLSILLIGSSISFGPIESTYAAPKKPIRCEALVASYATKVAEWHLFSEERKIRERIRHMLSYDALLGKKIERRPKLISTGLRRFSDPTMDPGDIKIDTADPSLVMPITYPNGVTKYRINFSGMRFVEFDRVEDFYIGGVPERGIVKRSRGFYADGTEMVGPYHNASWPWDVVIYKNDAGENIALGGVMRQPAPGQLPAVEKDNASRSRWWGKVKHIEVSPGVYEEHIIWQGPVHDFNRNHDTWVYHGYGGTLLTRFNPESLIHEPVKSPSGNYYLFYERVTEEKVINGKKMPWVTTMFAREMDPSLKKTVGPEIQVTDIINPKTGKPYLSTKRGAEGEEDGYLAEGGNVLIDINTHQAIKAFSGNDYVRKYGIYLDVVPTATRPMRIYKPVIQSDGEMIDFAKSLKLRELFDATWVGRPQMEYGPDKQLWMKFHFVPKASIPKNAPVEGWPTAKDFVKYGRITAMIPIRIVYDELANPSIKLDVDPEFEFMYQ